MGGGASFSPAQLAPAQMLLGGALGTTVEQEDSNGADSPATELSSAQAAAMMVGGLPTTSNQNGNPTSNNVITN